MSLSRANPSAAVSFPETSNLWASTTTTEVVSNTHHTNCLSFSMLSSWLSHILGQIVCVTTRCRFQAQSALTIYFQKMIAKSLSHLKDSWKEKSLQQEEGPQSAHLTCCFDSMRSRNHCLARRRTPTSRPGREFCPCNSTSQNAMLQPG